MQFCSLLERHDRDLERCRMALRVIRSEQWWICGRKFSDTGLWPLKFPDLRSAKTIQEACNNIWKRTLEVPSAASQRKLFLVSVEMWWKSIYAYIQNKRGHFQHVLMNAHLCFMFGEILRVYTTWDSDCGEYEDHCVLGRGRFLKNLLPI
jgi:hypothetical protein